MIKENPATLFSSQRSLPVRPLVDVVFLIAHSLWGENPAGYHLLQIGLHLVATLLLAWGFSRLDADLELSFLSALLFLLNVAHFRSVQWVILINYNLALIFGLVAILAYQRFMEGNRKRDHLIALVALSAATVSHPSAAPIGLFCTYLAWRRSKAWAFRWSFSTIVTGISYALAYLLSPNHIQTKAIFSQVDVSRITSNPLWYLGRLLSTAHWLTPTGIRNSTYPLELILGALIILNTIFLFKRCAFPATDWAVWTVLLVLPFVNTTQQTIGPSRQLYLASAGMSFPIAWTIRSLLQKVKLNILTRQIIFAALFSGLVASSIVALKRSEAIDYWLVGRSHIAIGDFETGISQFKRAIRQGPQVVPLDVYYRLGIISLSRGTWPHETFEKALKTHPNTPEFVMLSGVATFLSDDVEAQILGEANIQKAVEQITEKAQFQPNAATAYQNLAGYFHRTQNHEKAIVLYQKALALRPDYPAALFNFANALYRVGNIDDAIQMMKRASGAESVRWRALRNLGLMHQEQKQYNEAATVYLQMVQLRSRNVELRRNLGIVLEAQGNIEGAIEAYRHALALDPENTEIAVLLQKLLRSPNLR